MTMLISALADQLDRPGRKPMNSLLPGPGAALGFACACILAVIPFGCGSTSPSDATLVVEDLLVGVGAPVVSGDTVSLTYVGSFTDGKQFEAGKYTFRVGAGTVIKGWDQGLVGMRVGGKRRLTIPPSLAYGSEGSGAIPGNTTIKFEIDLLLIAGK